MTKESKNKRVLKLYRIDCDTEVSEIIKSASDYEEQTLIDPNISATVLYQKDNASTPGWKKFFKGVLKTDSALFDEEQSNSESFVCFLESANGQVYAVTGGYGHHLINPYCEKNFGTDILVRIIDEADQSLLAASEKSVTGGKIASSIHYRKTSRFYEHKSFGSITNSVSAEVTSSQIHDAFPTLSKADASKLKIVAGSNLQLKTSLNFEELVNLIEDCETVLKKEAKFTVNSIIAIRKSEHPKLIMDLEAELKKQLYDLYKGNEGAFPFDICHNDFDKYLGSSSIKLLVKRSVKGTDGTKRSLFVDFLQKRGEHVLEQNARELTDLRFGIELFDAMKKFKGKIKNADNLWSQLKTLHIHSYSPSGGMLTTGSFISHILGDVSLPNGNKFFLVDKQWYQLEQEFLNRLDNDCSSLIANQKVDLSLKPWSDSITEGSYNESYIGLKNYLCVDRLLLDNIEVCDLMFWDDDSLHLIHVKQEFGNTLRELCNQLLVSSSLLNEALLSEGRNIFLSRMHEKFKTMGGDSDYFEKTRAQFETTSVETFRSLFDKKINVVLAVKDTAQTERDISDVTKFRSTIGKFSLVDLNQKMRMSTFRFGITQIFKGEDTNPI